MIFVRKRRAPKGALRHGLDGSVNRGGVLVRKRRAPKGALRHLQLNDGTLLAFLSESAERQKVH